MGYTTDFEGKLSFDKPLTASQIAYIQAFNGTRRMKRNAAIAETFPDPLRIAVNLPIGEEGAYYVGSVSDGQMGQNGDKSVIDHNAAPGEFTFGYNEGVYCSENYKIKRQYISEGKCQPGLWCQWTVTNDGKYLEWDGGAKFYHYGEWLKYLITHFFSKWGVKLNGEIKWNGEDYDDLGKITVIDNEVHLNKAHITY